MVKQNNYLTLKTLFQDFIPELVCGAVGGHLTAPSLNSARSFQILNLVIVMRFSTQRGVS